MQPRFFSICVYLCLSVVHFSLAPRSRADEQWILTTADFKSETVSIHSIDANGIHIPGAGGDERTIPMTKFLQLDRAGQSRSAMPKLFVWLTTGDRVGGTPVGLSGESLAWKCPALGEIAFPMRQVRAIQSAAQAPPANDSPRTEDVLTLTNGDLLHGIVSEIGATNIVIQPAGGEATSVPLASLFSADFASPPGAATAPASPARAFRVSTADGTTITADSVSLSQRDLHLRLPGAAGERTIPLSSISGLEQINGPVIWLSSLRPVESVQIPSFSQRTRPAQMDRTVLREPIRAGEREFAHGIGVHSYSRLVFAVDPACSAFRTQYAIDGELPWADVTVRVKLDDRVAYEKEHIKSGPLSEVVKLNLKGAKRLTLEVDYGENYDVQDRLNWIEPALLGASSSAEH